MTNMQTYTRQQWDDAQAAWAAGDFSDEWKPWRHEAAVTAGIIFPPDGTKWDNWEDDSPSQRAMLIRAIRESPKALHDAIRRTTRPSWGGVLDVLLKDRDERRRVNDDTERDERRRVEEDAIDHRQSVMSLAEIVRRIDDSRAPAARIDGQGEGVVG